MSDTDKIRQQTRDNEEVLRLLEELSEVEQCTRGVTRQILVEHGILPKKPSDDAAFLAVVNLRQMAKNGDREAKLLLALLRVKGGVE